MHTNYRRWVIRETYFTELVWLGFSSPRYHIKLVSRELVIVKIHSAAESFLAFVGAGQSVFLAHLFFSQFDLFSRGSFNVLTFSEIYMLFK